MEACASVCEECEKSCDQYVATMREGSNADCASCAEVCDRCAAGCERYLQRDHCVKRAEAFRQSATTCRESSAQAV